MHVSECMIQFDTPFTEKEKALRAEQDAKAKECKEYLMIRCSMHCLL